MQHTRCFNRKALIAPSQQSRRDRQAARAPNPAKRQRGRERETKKKKHESERASKRARGGRERERESALSRAACEEEPWNGCGLVRGVHDRILASMGFGCRAEETHRDVAVKGAGFKCFSA